MMDQTTIDRYQEGGDIYKSFLTSYGKTGADTIAAAAATGDQPSVTDAIAKVKYGSPLNTSAWSLFEQQITTDPLAAPLEDANSILSNSFFSLLKNPAVLIALALVAFFYLGGMDYLRRKLASAK